MCTAQNEFVSIAGLRAETNLKIDPTAQCIGIRWRLGAGQKSRPWPNMDEILADANSDQARRSFCTAGVRIVDIEPGVCRAYRGRS